MLMWSLRLSWNNDVECASQAFNTKNQQTEIQIKSRQTRAWKGLPLKSTSVLITIKLKIIRIKNIKKYKIYDYETIQIYD